ncbi:hypothetical protein BU16DRAFT_562094 [Lophium mytilinum]|uniref:Uncharacterized protein n=1 Tax=Lophium mytilinum TaxID=390894 RepID=A0A6A6QU47_9PEZI|nr:hypothetical protein BU16DRAFT_562094 [Lophium mytilinum]
MNGIPSTQDNNSHLKRRHQEDDADSGPKFLHLHNQSSILTNPFKRSRNNSESSFTSLQIGTEESTKSRNPRASPTSLVGRTASPAWRPSSIYHDEIPPDHTAPGETLTILSSNGPPKVGSENLIHFAADKDSTFPPMVFENGEPHWEINIPGVITEDDNLFVSHPRDSNSALAHDNILWPFEAQEQNLENKDPATHMPPLAEVDTCFGAIEVGNCAIPPEFSNQRKKKREIDLDINGRLVTLRDPESRENVCTLHHDAALLITTLANEYGVTFDVAIKDCNRLWITLYGFQENSDTVGDFLAEKEYFLQAPDDYNRSVRYFNPQMLLRPVTDFQAYLDIESETPSNQTLPMDTATESRISAVLDSASGPTKFSEVQVSNKLETELMVHQKKALAMMVEKERGNIISPEFPSVWLETRDLAGKPKYQNTITNSSRRQDPSVCLGGILADDMGLGKSLTALALIAGSMQESISPSKDQSTLNDSTLIVAPLSTLPNWENEIAKHFKPKSITVTVYHGPKRAQHVASLQRSEIVLTTYDIVKMDSFQTSRAKSNELGPLHRVHWPHIIRNQKTKIFQGVATLQARHRWCLTGTPIQNNIEDLGALVQFLRVAPFDTPASFKNIFLTPIIKEQADGWMKLTSLIRAISLRRTKESERINLQLSKVNEALQLVKLDAREETIYNTIKRSFSLGIESSRLNDSVLQTILRLRQVCNHGSDLLPIAIQNWLDCALKSADIPPGDILRIQPCECCDDIMEIENDFEHLLLCLHSICSRCLMNTRDEYQPDVKICPICSNHSSQGHIREKSMTNTSTYTPSSKVKALLQNLAASGLDSNGNPVKSVVFSNWTRMLDLLEKAFERSRFTYQRIDGTKSLQQRREALTKFKEDSSCRVLLATLGSAAVGLDLTAASHVHLVEPGWNPMQERQALDRVNRWGQKNPVKAFRYVVETEDSVEKHIVVVQQRKLQLISSSFGDEKTISEELKHSINEFAKRLGG